jgi:hypothetical protein
MDENKAAAQSPFPTSYSAARKWASRELKQRKLTRFRNTNSHCDFGLLVDRSTGALLFPTKTKVDDLSYPSEYQELYDYLYRPPNHEDGTHEKQSVSVSKVDSTGQLSTDGQDAPLR